MADTANPSDSHDLLAMTAQIVAAHAIGNKLAAKALPDLVRSVHGALANIKRPSITEAPPQAPAVPVRRSIRPHYLICLEDGAKLKRLTRYLTRFGLTPDSYRAKWGLPKSYPMVAPASAKRSKVTEQTGLGVALDPVVPPSVELPPELPPEMPAVGTDVDIQHTASSVFANFPNAEPPSDPAAEVTQAAEKRPERKRFAQQSMQAGAWRSRAGNA